MLPMFVGFPPWAGSGYLYRLCWMLIFWYDNLLNVFLYPTSPAVVESHEQPWYCLCELGMFMIWRININTIWRVGVKWWLKLQMYYDFLHWIQPVKFWNGWMVNSSPGIITNYILCYISGPTRHLGVTVSIFSFKAILIFSFSHQCVSRL